jgi:hypothetical protein
MRDQRLFKAVVFFAIVALSVPALAQPAGRGRGGLFGDWIVKSEFRGQTMESILSFSRDQDGNQIGQWIGFGGVTELKDVRIEDGQVRFTREMRGREGQTMTSTFAGTVEDGRLSGTVSSNRGEYALEGRRAPRAPRVAGTWEMTLRSEDREFPVTLEIKADNEGRLSATWRSERGEMRVNRVELERNTLTMALKSDNPDRPWEATFEGQLRQDGLAGTIRSERGEMAAQGTRRGTSLIGTWNLDATADWGTRRQRLVVYPDMTALYNATPVKNVTLDGDNVRFKIVMSFGDRDFEMDFRGKIQDGKLTGEMTTGMGSQTITGTRVVRPLRRRNP